MTEARLLQDVAQWLLTYLVHSTLLLGLALGVSWALRLRALWLQEGLLRGALLGGLLTASLHPAVAPPVPPAPAVRSEVPRPVRLPVGLERSFLPPLPPLPPLPLLPAVAPSLAPQPSPSPSLAASWSLRAPAGRWQVALVLASLALSLLLLSRYLLAWRRLHLLLADRQSVRDPVVRGLLAPLLAAARLGPVRLVSSHRVTVPLAIGTHRPEICLPERALVELPHDDLRSILAHEVAHLLRRDPTWRILLRLIVDGLPLQPLNRLAARRLQTLAEYQCDDFSAERTGRPLVLARSLTEVAGWLLGRHGAEEVPGALGTESELSSRVRRLIAWEKRSEPMAKSAYVFGLSGALLVGVVACAPRVTVARAEQRPPAVPAEGAVAPAEPARGRPLPPSHDATIEALASELREAVRASVPTTAQRAELRNKAHELAQAVRSDDKKRQQQLERELGELSQRQVDPAAMAKVAQLQARAAHIAREAMQHAGLPAHAVAGEHTDVDEDVREAAREALVASHESVREALEQAREAAEEAREQAREAEREARARAREMRQAARQARELHEEDGELEVHPPVPPTPPVPLRLLPCPRLRCRRCLRMRRGCPRIWRSSAASSRPSGSSSRPPAPSSRPSARSSRQRGGLSLASPCRLRPRRPRPRRAS
jgi:beta-lactamase regulating signal transducer with metallopeptidase domain